MQIRNRTALYVGIAFVFLAVVQAFTGPWFLAVAFGFVALSQLAFIGTERKSEAPLAFFLRRRRERHAREDHQGHG